MINLAIYYEQDDGGKDTGRVQVVEDDEFVLDAFDTEEEAEKYMTKLRDEDIRDDKIKEEYLQWEKGCIIRHKISEEDLRVYLVNFVQI